MRSSGVHRALASYSLVLFAFSCGTDPDSSSDGGNGSAAAGGRAADGSAGGGASGNGGSSGAGGSAGGSAGVAGAAGGGVAGVAGSAGSAGTDASGGAAGAGGAVCPPGSDALALNLMGASPQRVTGVPPSPAQGQNIEGPVWIGDSLYLSEITFGTGVDPARILKHTPGSGTTVFLDGVTGGMPGEDAGTNGLALDNDGNLLAARHYDGSISRIDLRNPSDITPLVTSYMGNRFNSPNDLAVHTNGGIYFTDPDYQGPSPAPQAQERAYWVPRGGMPQPIAGAPSKPNGIALSRDEATLFILGNNGLFRFPVAADGSVGTGTSMTNQGGDGMGKDCAGNLYITQGNRIRVFDRSFREAHSRDPRAAHRRFRHQRRFRRAQPHDAVHHLAPAAFAVQRRAERAGLSVLTATADSLSRRRAAAVARSRLSSRSLRDRRSRTRALSVAARARQHSSGKRSCPSRRCRTPDAHR